MADSNTAIGFIYAIFFSQSIATKSSQLWAAISGLSFMIGGTVTEFIACCIFLFVKHPYDVGECRIDALKLESGQMLIVLPL